MVNQTANESEDITDTYWGIRLEIAGYQSRRKAENGHREDVARTGRQTTRRVDLTPPSCPRRVWKGFTPPRGAAEP